MKMLYLLFWIMFCSNFSLAQKADLIKRNSAISTSLDDSAVYVVDGRVSANKLAGIDPKTIFSINIINKAKASEMFEGDARHGFVVVVTKANAMKTYQKRLSAYSAHYAKILATNKGDNDFDYVINGTAYKASRDKSTRTLYSLKPENIQSVKIDDDMGICLDHSVIVRIKTKIN